MRGIAPRRRIRPERLHKLRAGLFQANRASAGACAIYFVAAAVAPAAAFSTSDATACGCDT